MQRLSRPLPRPFAMPWGSGQIVEEASIVREHWEPTIQLLRYEDGTEALRFCYYQGPRFGRGPMLLDTADLDALAKASVNAPRLAEHLRRLGGGPSPSPQRRSTKSAPRKVHGVGAPR